MLYINNLWKYYGKTPAVSGLSLHIPEGDLFGFVGPNGAGKTTTMRIICGLLRASGGSVTVNGVDAINNTKNIKRVIGYVPDFFGVYNNLKVKEYMEFYGSMYGMYTRDIQKISGDLLELVNLSDKNEEYVDSLSRGMKQRLCVARALIHNPKLLVLDEPNSGLDPRARVEMKELLKNLSSMGKTIMISSHILSELSEMCNSVGIMNHGVLVAAGKIEDIMSGQAIPPQNMPQQNIFQGVRLTMNVLGSTDMPVRILKENPMVSHISIMERKIEFTLNGGDKEIAAIIAGLVNAGVPIVEIKKQEKNLESLFMQVTDEDNGMGGDSHEN